MRRFLLILVLTAPWLILKAQPHSLQPGFNKEEFIDLLKLSAYQLDTPWTNMKVDLPAGFELIYRSPVVALENRFDVWLNKNQQALVINVRGTTGSRASWLENFYAAMVPAQGSLQLSDSVTFEYTLADNPKAAVHAGWLTGMAAMAPAIVFRIDSAYKAGIRNFYLTGHSQGGGITFLLTAYLYHLQEVGKLPADIRFKTYCSAAPKPGNLYFAYDYEYMTRGGWAFNVVNSLDWVPETPFSIQTVQDFNQLNPFTDAHKAISKLRFPVNLVINHIYKKLSKPTIRARDNFQKYLGEKAAGIIVKKDISEFKEPEYYNSNNYQRCGRQIVMIPGEDYLKTHPDDPNNIFVHHLPLPYLYLAERLQGYDE